MDVAYKGQRENNQAVWQLLYIKCKIIRYGSSWFLGYQKRKLTAGIYRRFEKDLGAQAGFT